MEKKASSQRCAALCSPALEGGQCNRGSHIMRTASQPWVRVLSCWLPAASGSAPQASSTRPPVPRSCPCSRFCARPAALPGRPAGTRGESQHACLAGKQGLTSKGDVLLRAHHGHGHDGRAHHEHQIPFLQGPVLLSAPHVAQLGGGSSGSSGGGGLRGQWPQQVRSAVPSGLPIHPPPAPAAELPVLVPPCSHRGESSVAGSPGGGRRARAEEAGGQAGRGDPTGAKDWAFPLWRRERGPNSRPVAPTPPRNTLAECVARFSRMPSITVFGAASSLMPPSPAQSSPVQPSSEFAAPTTLCGGPLQ